MTSTIRDDCAVGGISIWQRLSDMSVTHRRVQYRIYRSTVRVLSPLSSRELTDIGIHPADIHDVAQQGACCA